MGKANDLKNYLPNIIDRQSNNSGYDSYEPTGYRSRLGYRKQMESAGMSRALGVNAQVNRYDGVEKAIRMARELSKENIHMASNQVVRMERGPCPKHIARNPSIPSIISESDR